jgi:thioredoxin reductase (NADPH)
MYDLIIVGGGPAGLAAALCAGTLSLDYLVIEKGLVADTVRQYPLRRRLFSTPDEVELVTGSLSPGQKPTRETVIDHYINTVAESGIRIKVGEEVLHIEAEGDSGFRLHTTIGVHEARTVLLAVGGFGVQRMLGVPGDDLPFVSYRFAEAEPFSRRKTLVIGGGNSAAEATLALADVNADVTLSIRQESLRVPSRDGRIGEAEEKEGAPRPRIKPWVLEPLERAIDEGKAKLVPLSRVVRVSSDGTVLLKTPDRTIELKCDHVFALIGADPDTTLLRRLGAGIAADGRPVYDPDTFESTVRGVFVTGHLTRDLHMKNAVTMGRPIVEHIASFLLHQGVGG